MEKKKFVGVISFELLCEDNRIRIFASFACISLSFAWFSPCSPGEQQSKKIS